MIEHDLKCYLVNLDCFPKTWTRATIGDLVSCGGIFVDGDWIESKDQDPSGDVRLIQLADIGDGFYRNRSARFLTNEKAKSLKCTFLNRNDLLVARMPDPLGRACVFPGDHKLSVTAVDVCIIRTGESGVNQRWLMYAINSPKIRSIIASLESGTTRKRISRKNLSKIVFPVPPLGEQERISVKIEELFSKLDAGIDALTKAQALLKRYRASVLKAACEGRLVPTEAELARQEGRDYESADKLLARILKERRAAWEAAELEKMARKGIKPNGDAWKKKYKEPAAPKTDDLPDLPEEWSWATVEQLASGKPRSIQSGPFGSHLHHSEFQNEGALAIGIDNVLDCKFSIGKKHKISWKKYEELKKFKARPSDILITVMATIGRCAVVPEDIEHAIITKHVYRITPELKIIDPYFFMFALAGGLAVLNQIHNQVRGQTRPGINGEILRTIVIPLPPREEQFRITAVINKSLSIVEEIGKGISSELRRASQLKQSTLHMAFHGKLVPQDPNDEPASVLLERIKAARDQAKPSRNLARTRRTTRRS